MPLTSGDILVYDGSQWSNQPSTSNAINLDSGTFYLDSVNNRVGFGTTSPATRLHAVAVGATMEARLAAVPSPDTKDVSVSLYEDTQRKGRYIYTGANAAGFRYTGLLNDDGDWLMLATLNNKEIRFYTNDTDRMRLTSGGDLGIGTTSPNGKAEIAGTADNEQLIVRAYSTQTNDIFQVRDSSSSRMVGIAHDGKVLFDSSGDTNLYRSTANTLATDDDFALLTAGKGVKIKEGTNAKMGVATLASGTVTVSTTAVTASSRIMLTPQNAGSAQGHVYVSARTAGTSFTITSTNGSDNRDVAWILFEPS